MTSLPTQLRSSKTSSTDSRQLTDSYVKKSQSKMKEQLVHRDRELWDEFCHDLNQWHGLEWECEVPSTTVDFMDLTITIIGNHVETTIFEKPQNLYLYMPAHSLHPPWQGTMV